jgi:hypothetical protein
VAIRTDQQVALDANRDRLRIAKAVGRRVAAGTGVVIVEVGDAVEKQEAANVGQLRVQLPAKPALEPLLGGAGKSLLRKRRCELFIEVRSRWHGLARVVRTTAAAEQDRADQCGCECGHEPPVSGACALLRMLRAITLLRQCSVHGPSVGNRLSTPAHG